MGFAMVMVNKCGRMVLAMREIGRRIKHKVMENYITVITMCMKGNGLRIRQMERVSIHMQMGQNIMEIGKTISNMVMVRNPGQMGLFMKVNIMKAKRMGKEN